MWSRILSEKNPCKNVLTPHLRLVAGETPNLAVEMITARRASTEWPHRITYLNTHALNH